MTLLVVHRNASDRLVETLLQTIYEDPVLSQTYYVTPIDEAAEWPFFPYHSTARQFYENRRLE
jgi:hypothetical protein